MPRRVEIPGPPPRIPLTVHEVRASPGGLVVLKLDPLPVPWEPGDCIAVYAPDSGVSRPYSLSGGRQDPWTELLVRRIPGGRVSEWLTGLCAGMSIDVSPPFGWFRPAEPPDAPKLYVATGSGIAPFWSAIRSGAHAPSKVLWGIRNRGDLLNEDLFPDLEVWLSRETAAGYHAGRLTLALETIPLEEGVHIYACGLDRMIEASFEILHRRGVPAERFHRESFFTGSSTPGS